MDSKGYHDQKASFGPKKAPQKYDFFEKLTFPHFFSPVLLSTSYLYLTPPRVIKNT
jgi:hypothetical protein